MTERADNKIERPRAFFDGFDGLGQVRRGADDGEGDVGVRVPRPRLQHAQARARGERRAARSTSRGATRPRRSASLRYEYE